MEALDSTAGIVALAAAAVAVVALLVAVITTLRMSRLRSAQKAVLGELGETDLVSHALKTERRVDDLADGIDEISRVLSERMDETERRLDGAVTRAAVVRYDAFNESTGRQSSSVALLDVHGNGVVLSAILQREQARVYAKPVRGGESDLELSPEEREALQVAEENATQ